MPHSPAAGGGQQTAAFTGHLLGSYHARVFFFLLLTTFLCSRPFRTVKNTIKYMFDLIYFPEHINIVIALKSKTLTLGVVHDLLTKVASRTSHVYLGTVFIRHEGEFTKI